MDSTAPSPEPLADDAACAAAIARIGALDGLLTKISADKDAAVAAAAAKAEAKAAPLDAERARLAAAVEDYCDLNRARLTEHGTTKTAAFTTGECSWRKGADAVEVDSEQEKRIIARLKAMGKAFRRFVKITEAVSKTALKAATEEERRKLARLPGLAFKAGEERFAISPVALPLVQEARRAEGPTGNARKATGRDQAA